MKPKEKFWIDFNATLEVYEDRSEIYENEDEFVGEFPPNLGTDAALLILKGFRRGKTVGRLQGAAALRYDLKQMLGLS
jgi:hypothetical protein